MQKSFDAVVIGGGIAGASAAFHLAESRSVVLLEREDHAGYHSTGRSVATFSETYGNPIVRSLTVGSRSFFEAPPSEFSEHPLLLDRGVLTLARADQWDRVCATAETLRAADKTISLIDADEVRQRVPILRASYVRGGIWKPRVMDIDVSGLHQGFLRAARRLGVQIRTSAEVVGLEWRRGEWIVQTNSEPLAAKVVVNAAGAWADVVAQMAGIAPLGLVPKRRTAMTFAAPTDVDISGWPMVVDADEQFYFKSESGRILASPCDETPVAPCDVQPDEIDIAHGIDRVQRAAELPVQRVERAWAGLRSFVADRTPVAGYEDTNEGFFWLAGQGGYGIQTAPAMGRVAAAFVAGKPLPADLINLGLSASQLAPGRLRK